MSHTSLVSPELWDDLKSLKKKYKRPELKPTLDDPEEEIDQITKIKSIPLFRAISTYISNSCTQGEQSNFDLWDLQPYLTQGWLIYKARYGFAGMGKSNGLRIIFMENVKENQLLFGYINIKSECADEKLLRKEVLKRLKNYFGETN